MQLSPDGRSLAFLQPSPSTRVSSVFVTALPPSSGSSTSSSSSSQSSGSSTSSNSAPSASIPATSLLARGLLKPVQVTHTPTPVGDFFWAKDGKGILFVVDSGAGTENYHLHWVPLTFGDDSSSSSKQQGGQADSGAQITPGTAVNLTPFKGEQARGHRQRVCATLCQTCLQEDSTPAGRVYRCFGLSPQVLYCAQGRALPSEAAA